MATDKEMFELLARVLVDDQFRASLLADPEQALAGAGYTLTDEQLAGLKRIDLLSLSENLGERLSRLRTEKSSLS